MDVPGFRAAFPEFANAVRYPDAVIERWMTFGQEQTSAERFGTKYEMGVYLFTAHHLVGQVENMETAEAEGIPGTFGGGVKSRSVGSMSTSNDTGFWNQTGYGRQYMHYRRLFGAGVMVIC